MATTTLTSNPQTISVSGTTDHEINFDNMLADGDNYGSLLINVVSGTVKFNTRGSVDDTNSSSYTAGDKEILEAKRGVTLHYKGSAGGESFKVAVLSQ
jgi:hypothetical protein